jgi:predicted nucleic acid-binding protein
MIYVLDACALILADAFGLATASVYDGAFVTCDHHELGKFEGHVKIPFHWIR